MRVSGISRRVLLQVAACYHPLGLPLPEAESNACQHGDSAELGAVAIGNDKDPYFSNVAWVPSLRLMWCKSCGNLWAKEKEEQ